MPEMLRPCDIGCEPSPSIPAETLLASGEATYLLFFAVSKQVDPQTGYLRDLGVAIVECVGCAMTRFGYPNDEGRPEHDLYALGLEAESNILELPNSPWVSEVCDQMRRTSERIWGERDVSLDASSTNGLRHFLILLKEKTFECLASGLVVRTYARDFDEAFTWVRARFMES